MEPKNHNILRLLEWCCPSYLYEGIEGDLLEQYQRDLEVLGEKKACRKLFWNAIRFIRPEIILRNKFSNKEIIPIYMFTNYVKIALRSLWRSKVHSLINILGLSLGIACCILISLYVHEEWTYDTFHTKASRIYRVFVREDWGENQQFFNTVTPFPMGPALKDNFPEVEQQVRVSPFGSQVKVGENQYNESVTIGGENFFDVFDFEFLSGDRNALHQANGIVITERAAKKYFGDINPIDKVLSVQMGQVFEDFSVKAVLADLPTNSSIQFDLLISDANFPKLYDQQVLTSGWFNVTVETYVLLREGADVKQLEGKFPVTFKTLLGEENYNQSKYAPGLQPLTDIHLNPQYPVGIAPVSNSRYTYILAAIATLIMIVACINFVTLSIARSLKRAREVGVRKVVGALRIQLVTQFVGEAVIVTCIASVFGVLMAWLSLSTFNELSGKQLLFPWNGFLLTLIAGMLLLIGLIAGSYPAFVLSGFKPIRILKGGITMGDSRQQLRKVLVGVQLVLSIFLISSTLIMNRQLNFLMEKDLGFNKEQLVVIRLQVPRVGGLTERVTAGFEKAELYKTELGKMSEISEACASSHDFGNGAWTNVGYTDNQGVYRNFNLNVVDDEYINTLKMEIVQGRSFGQDNLSDKRRGVLVNEAFAKEYGWTNTVGMKIPGKRFLDHEVIGVVKDFNYSSLYAAIEPVVLVQDPGIIMSGVENISINSSPMPKLIVRLQAGSVSPAIDKIKAVWQKIDEGSEFTFTFVDQALAAQYKSDQNLGKIVRNATMLAILIGSLGLYALASLAMQNRTKEISIRKVFGATEQSLLLLLSKDYVYLIFISLALSVPFTLYLMRNWLKAFEYRITIGWDIFLLAGMVSLAIALIAISYQAIKTAWTKPAESLKYE